jgi:hypothetical protein
METLLVISHLDLANYGCPHCGSSEGSAFFNNGSCSIYCCEHCCSDCLLVGSSVIEVEQFTLRNTDIRNLIGRHPYRNDIITINTFSIRAPISIQPN